MFLLGALGRSGRKRSRRAVRFLGGQGGFLTASTVMAAVGMAWGLYDSMRGAAAAPASPTGPTGPTGPTDPTGAGPTAPATPAAAPTPSVAAAGGPPSLVVPLEVARVVRLAASAAGADGHIAESERALLLQHARKAGVEGLVDEELRLRRPLAEIVAGVGTDADRRDLYVLAFTIVRADETISGAERVYLAQLAHALGLAAPAAAALEQQTAVAIDGAGPAPATA